MIDDPRAKNTQELAQDYLAYLGRHMPQQCASDEFYYLPRSETALDFLHLLDDLSADRIQDHLGAVKNYLNLLPESGPDLEDEVDRRLVKQSLESFLLLFGTLEAWKTDPTLYVKIPLFSLNHLMSGAIEDLSPRAEAFSEILGQIPGFLETGLKNLGILSSISRRTALEMALDAERFQQSDVGLFITLKFEDDPGLLEKNRAAVRAWGRYRSGLRNLKTREGFAVGEEILDRILSQAFSYPGTAAAVLRTAKEAVKETESRIKNLERQLEEGPGGRKSPAEPGPGELSPEVLMAAYKKEVEGLRRFFQQQETITFPPRERVILLQTPDYLKSLRAAASYQAPLTGTKGGAGVFYLTPGQMDSVRIFHHRAYLSAHETYPGHHILDHIRLHHPNPLYRQIESPLFYEGWACYSETLLDELGYVQDPGLRLIQLKRQLWRCWRAVLDVELQTEKTTLRQAADRIEQLGYSAQRAERQIRRFALTPGYQLCYFLGMHEILRLRELFGSKMDLKSFHDVLLSGGQIPFFLAEKRMRIEARRGRLRGIFLV